ncbi:MAG: heavy metal translocating P-type ATPase [Chloroflexota bacterium]
MFITVAVGGSALYAVNQRYKRTQRRRRRLATFLQEPTEIMPKPAQKRTVNTFFGDQGQKKQAGFQTLTKTIVEQIKTKFQHQRQDNSVSPSNKAIAVADTSEKHLDAQDINQQIVTFSAALGLGIAGIVISPALGMAGLLLTGAGVTRWYFTEAGKSLFEERKVRISLLDSILWGTCLVTGHFMMAAWGCLVISASRKILAKTEDDSRASLTNVFGEQPRSLWILVDDVEVEIPFEKLMHGNIIVVNSGETIPIDGTIVNGVASIDQHKLTGESQPLEIGCGDPVFASTLVLSGKIHIKVEQTGEETVAAQIGEVLNNTADFRASIQSRGEAIADKTAVPMLLSSLCALPFLGINCAVGILNANFGYNMRVLAPISILKFLNLTSEQGILIKDGRSLELLNQVDTVVFDKTGTLTEEIPSIRQIYACDGVAKDEVLKYAAAAEYKQQHPIARAILEEAQSEQIRVPQVDSTEYKLGYGLMAKLGERLIRVGSSRFMGVENICIPQLIQEAEASAHEQGHTLVLVAMDDRLIGALELCPTVRAEAKSVIDGLRSRGIQSTYIISGDHHAPTRRLAEDLGIDHYFANTLPEDKANLIEGLQKVGKVVCYIGDGINDSIALKKANVSISLSGASTIATDTAQIILMDVHLMKLCQLLDIAKSYEKSMKTAMVATVVPGVLCLASVFWLHFGILQSIILNQTALAIGIANLMRPAKKMSTNDLMLEVGNQLHHADVA